MEFSGIENAAVLGSLDGKAVLLAEVGDGVFENAWLAVDALDDLMFETGRLGEDQQGFGRRRNERAGKGSGRAGDGRGLQEFATICGIFHDVLLEFND